MKNRFNLFALSAFGALLGLSVLLGEPAFGAEPAAAIEKKIEAATSKSDHEELAAYYEQEAKAAAAKSEDHHQQAERYKKGPGYGNARDSLVAHCNFIANKYKEAGAENLKLAKLHRDLAAKAKQ